MDEPQTYYRIRIIQTGVAGRALHITPAQSSPELAAMALMREGLGHYKAFRGTQLWLDKGEVVRDGQGHIIIDWIRQERLGEPK